MNAIQTTIPARSLPPVEDLEGLDQYQREILLARLIAERNKRRRKNVEAAISLPDIADWIEEHCYDASKVRNPEEPQGSPKVRLEPFQKRILRKCFTIDPRTGRFPYRTVVYSAPKKSGKSAIGGMVTTWFAACVEAPNAIYVLANDREQSSTRVYASAKPNLFGLGARRDGRYKLDLPNGSYVQASTSDPEKEAGASYGLTVWDELWAYKSERAQLLWDELRPIGTRTNSMRLVVTYAGFEDSSDLLLMLYKKVFANTEETALQDGARAVPELEDIRTTNGKGESIPACYEVPEAGLFYFNDHEQRMSWQQGEHGEALTREITALESLETNTFRLTHNRWQATMNRFVLDDPLQMSFVAYAAESPVLRPMTFGVDAGWMRDCSALVGTYDIAGRYISAYAKAWYPKKEAADGGGMDLNLVKDEIIRLYKAGLISKRDASPGEKLLVQKEGLICVDVHYDPTQLHQIAMDLRKGPHKLLLRPFDQKNPRLLADTFLQDCYNTFRIDNTPSAELQSHLEAARAESQLDANRTLVRIVKGTGTYAKPIDLAVAQSMSVFRRSERPAKSGMTGIAQGKAKGWSRR